LPRPWDPNGGVRYPGATMASQDWFNWAALLPSIESFDGEFGMLALIDIIAAVWITPVAAGIGAALPCIVSTRYRAMMRRALIG